MSDTRTDREKLADAAVARLFHGALVGLALALLLGVFVGMVIGFNMGQPASVAEGRRLAMDECEASLTAILNTPIGAFVCRPSSMRLSLGGPCPPGTFLFFDPEKAPPRYCLEIGNPSATPQPTLKPWPLDALDDPGKEE